MQTERGRVRRAGTRRTSGIRACGAVSMALAVACGNGDDASPQSPDGGSQSMGGDGSGGSSATAPDAAGGGGGQAATAPPEPTVDCASQTQTNHCMSAAGLIDGQPFDFSCLGDTGGDRGRVTIGPNLHYSLNCDATQEGYSLHLSLLQPDPGTFTVTLPGSNDQLRIRSTDQSGSSDGDNFDSGTVSGTLERTTGALGDIDTITGTFEAAWSEGDATCTGGCVPIVVEGSFRTVFDF